MEFTLLRPIVSPFQGSEIFNRLTQGGADPGRRGLRPLALGYHMPGFQPFESAFICVHLRLKDSFLTTQLISAS